ncbi:MAG: ATP-dependent helicase, partial [Rhizobacter sp.]
MTRDEAIRLWLDALRRGADAAELRGLPTLSDEDAARVMTTLRGPPPAVAPAAPRSPAPTTHSLTDTPVPGELVPRLTLQTLTRGDGLLGLRALEGFGPRGAQLTVARIDWTYTLPGGLGWETPAPVGALNTRPKPTQLLRGAWNERVLLQRDLPAEADARDALAATGLRPLPMRAIQWRDREAGVGHGELWSLAEESQFGDFWAEHVPRLRAAGWAVIVQPGFAHLSAPVDRWHLVIDPATGDAQAHLPAGV